MSQYKMDITGSIGLQDYSSIHDYISLVDNNERFTVTLDDIAKDSIDIIESILLDNGFNIFEKGVDNQGKYYIDAKKYNINNKLTM